MNVVVLKVFLGDRPFAVITEEIEIRTNEEC